MAERAGGGRGDGRNNISSGTTKNFTVEKLPDLKLKESKINCSISWIFPRVIKKKMMFYLKSNSRRLWLTCHYPCCKGRKWTQKLLTIAKATGNKAGWCKLSTLAPEPMAAHLPTLHTLSEKEKLFLWQTICHHSPSPGNNPCMCEVLLWNVDHSSSIYKIISQCFYWLFCVLYSESFWKGVKSENPLQCGTRREFGPHEAYVFPLMFMKMGLYFFIYYLFFLRWDLALLPKLGWNS